jgi:hypothetical protein
MTFLRFWTHYQSHIKLSCPLRKWRSKLVKEFCWCNVYFQSTFGIIYTSVCPVHNAQVCYFNNVWFMFLVF